MLEQKTYFIREHVGLLKLADTYDILDPESGRQIGIAQEKPGALVFLLRLFMDKQTLPTKVFVHEGENTDDASTLRFYIRRGLTLLRSRVDVCDPNGTVLGWFKSKILTLGGGFTVFDANGTEVAEVKGDWKGWNFALIDKTGGEIGTVTKKWAGIGKELFSSADNYIVSLSQEPSPQQAIMLLAAGLAIDIIYKEA